MKKIISCGVLSASLVLSPVWAANQDSSSSKSTTQKIGGLLFDVDEGVKVEQGSGGSVYVKSNKEYMQQKLKEIDARLQDLEERVTKVEGRLKSAETEKNKEAGESRKVLST